MSTAVVTQAYHHKHQLPALKPAAMQALESSVSTHYTLTVFAFCDGHDGACEPAERHDDAKDLDAVAHHPHHEAHEANLLERSLRNLPQRLQEFEHFKPRYVVNDTSCACTPTRTSARIAQASIPCVQLALPTGS
jgi:hypothetical protein